MEDCNWRIIRRRKAFAAVTFYVKGKVHRTFWTQINDDGSVWPEAWQLGPNREVIQNLVEHKEPAQVEPENEAEREKQQPLDGQAPEAKERECKVQIAQPVALEAQEDNVGARRKKGSKTPTPKQKQSKRQRVNPTPNLRQARPARTLAASSRAAGAPAKPQATLEEAYEAEIASLPSKRNRQPSQTLVAMVAADALMSPGK